MDDPDIPVGLLHKNLGELDSMNRYAGGHSISLSGIKRMVNDRHKIYHIADLGCGSGDVLKYIARWARINQYQVKLTGVDKSKDAIMYLSENCSGFDEISGVVSDYQHYLESAADIDIVHCSLFCHHLSDNELHDLFTKLKTKARLGFVINDLHRSPLAYYGVWFLTRLLNGTDLSKHDGPVSVLSAFKHSELDSLLRNAGLNEFSIQWKWAFRYLVLVQTNKIL